MSDNRWVYKGALFSDPGISPVSYKSDYFYQEIELESEVFQELRRANKVEPYCLRDSTEQELEEIWDFFDKWAESFFFLFDTQHRLIGSILIKRNYIQCLSVAKQFQRQGYGLKLSQYGINYILNKGFASVELDTMSGNLAAECLYEGMGFVPSVEL